MKTLVLLSLIVGLDAAETDISVKIQNFRLPDQTEMWVKAIMDVVHDVLPGDMAAQGTFQELVNWSCGEHADLKSTDPRRREETIKFSLNQLVAMRTSDARVAYIAEQLERHKRYVPKK